MNPQSGELPGVMTVGPAPSQTPPAPQAREAPALLDLARLFDEMPEDQIENRIAIGKLMEPQLGDRADEFDTRFTVLFEKAPKFPWPAEALVRGMGFVPQEQTFTGKAGALTYGVRPLRFLSDEKHVLLDCGCASDGSRRILVCDAHREETSAEAPRESAQAKK